LVFSRDLHGNVGIAMVRIDDLCGPYADIQSCYQRSSEMIKDVVTDGHFPPLLQLQGFCFNHSHKKLLTTKPDEAAEFLTFKR